ncbi:hypothetical protein HPG02_00435 [Pediococcus pentosaceus]|uniref:hypothetical protein n=1 Tax=Pediococcus pentosaceus TaxID=1255 RepID=UPI001C1EF277|nr:hypothetical protein [Pediococcus pentosaceus]MBU7002104.1 hypothetical protein [Pediococcus pentosaceus]MCG9227404.1 hypothetical protein [Pediococcus pentosaceus]MDA8037459.1 hypothetical protein [Pediococcus pentosaceus]
MSKDIIIRNITEEQHNQLRIIANEQGYTSLNEFMQDQITEIIALNALDAAKYVFQPVLNDILSQVNQLSRTEDAKLNNIYGQVVKNNDLLLSLFELMGINEQPNLNFDKESNNELDQGDINE